VRIQIIIFVFLILASLVLGCSSTPTSPKPGVIAVSVNAGTNYPVKDITVDLLQTSQTKLTDSTGIAAFEVDPGTYTVRVHGLQGPGPLLRNIDSTVSINAGQADTLRFFDCLMCL
jgi:hypothetical protein